MHQPYIYTMPEEFMEDSSVPCHWRLLGVLNGFFINDHAFYGSNEWLMMRLNVKSERTIQEAIKELERMDKIACERTGNTRIIRLSPRNQLRGTPQPTNASPRNQLRPNSVSNNSASEIPFEAEASRTLVPEEDSFKRATYSEKAGYPTDKVKPILKWAESVAGRTFPNRRTQETSISRCLRSGYSEESIKNCFESLLADKYWGERGIDFGTVVSQIGKAKRSDKKDAISSKYQKYA